MHVRNTQQKHAEGWQNTPPYGLRRAAAPSQCTLAFCTRPALAWTWCCGPQCPLVALHAEELHLPVWSHLHITHSWHLWKEKEKKRLHLSASIWWEAKCYTGLPRPGICAGRKHEPCKLVLKPNLAKLLGSRRCLVVASCLRCVACSCNICGCQMEARMVR